MAKSDMTRWEGKTKLSLAGMLAKCCKFPTKGEKVEFLKQNYSLPLIQFLAIAFDPRIEFDLPNERPPFTPTDQKHDTEDHLFNAMRKFYLYLKAPNHIYGTEGNTNIRQIRREQLFIQLLESLQDDDAELVLSVLEKKQLPWKGLTPIIINAAFPDLILIPPKEKGQKEEKEEVEA